MTRVTAVPLALAASVLIAACGGSGGSGGSGGGPGSGTATNRAQAVKFAACIRAHGVPEFPDSGNYQSSGNTTGGGSATVAGQAIPQSVLDAAYQKCSRENPVLMNIPRYTVAEAAKVQAGALKFAACVRAHGIPDFPDQRIEPGPGGRGYRYVTVGRARNAYPQPAYRLAYGKCIHLIVNPS